MDETVYGNWSSNFGFDLDQTVSITESSFPSPSLTKLLSELGGSLGLWLGLGLLQLCFSLIELINCGGRFNVRKCNEHEIRN